MSKLRHRESWYTRTKNELEEMEYKKILERAKAAYGTGAYDDATLEFLFPDLKVSEDERMINGLQGFLSAFGSDYFGTGGWQKFDEWLERQKEQKSEWSEADEVYLEDALWCVKQATKVAKGENDMGACWSAERWLKSLPERFEAKEGKK